MNEQNPIKLNFPCNSRSCSHEESCRLLSLGCSLTHHLLSQATHCNPSCPPSGEGFLRRGSEEDPEGLLHLRGVQGELLRPGSFHSFFQTFRLSGSPSCRSGEAQAEDPRGALRRRRPPAAHLCQAGEHRDGGRSACLCCVFVSFERLRPLGSVICSNDMMAKGECQTDTHTHCQSAVMKRVEAGLELWLRDALKKIWRSWFSWSSIIFYLKCSSWFCWSWSLFSPLTSNEEWAERPVRGTGRKGWEGVGEVLIAQL